MVWCTVTGRLGFVQFSDTIYRLVCHSLWWSIVWVGLLYPYFFFLTLYCTFKMNFSAVYCTVKVASLAVMQIILMDIFRLMRQVVYCCVKPFRIIISHWKVWYITNCEYLTLRVLINACKPIEFCDINWNILHAYNHGMTLLMYFSSCINDQQYTLYKWTSVSLSLHSKMMYFNWYKWKLAISTTKFCGYWTVDLGRVYSINTSRLYKLHKHIIYFLTWKYGSIDMLAIKMIQMQEIAQYSSAGSL